MISGANASAMGFPDLGAERAISHLGLRHAVLRSLSERSGNGLNRAHKRIYDYTLNLPLTRLSLRACT